MPDETNPIFTGQVVTELQAQLRFSPQQGWQTVRTWRGKREAVEALVAQVAFGAIGVELHGDAPYAELAVTYGFLFGQDPANDPTQIQSLWSLAANVVQKPLMEHPSLVEVFNSSPPKYQLVTGAPGAPSAVSQGAALVQFNAQIQRLQETPQAPETVVWDVYDLSGAVAGVFRFYYTALLNNVTTFVWSQFVLRHVNVVAPGSSVKPSYKNVLKFYTAEQLKAAERIPATIQFELPVGPWLKQTPTLEQLPSGKFQITQEWWSAAGNDQLIYPPVTNADL